VYGVRLSCDAPCVRPLPIEPSTPCMEWDCRVTHTNQSNPKLYFRGMPDPSCKCAQADVLVEHFEYRHIASLQTRPVWWHVLHICFPNPSTNLPFFTGHLCEKVVYILPFTNFDKIFTGRLHCSSKHSCECVAMGSAMASILVAAARLVPPFFLLVRAKSSRSVHVPANDVSLLDNKYTIDDFVEPPSDAVDAPAVTALAAAFWWLRLPPFSPPFLRDSNTPCWYAGHPVVPALAKIFKNNDLYWRCTSSEKAFRRGRPLNILHDS